jgi:FkbM family methyltransferase
METPVPKMKRTPSLAAQFAFDTTNRLQVLATRPNFAVRFFAKITNKLTRPLADRLTAHRLVEANLYGQRLRMPSEHHIGLILRQYPQYNRPLALAVRALADSGSQLPLAVVDVGANIGETIAVIEERNPDCCTYLCIEADEEIAELCRFNHHGNPRVQTVQCFIGENEGAIVRLEDDGKANPSTKLGAGPTAAGATANNRLTRLDTVVIPFAEAQGTLSLLKIDVEGYDFSVLRSGPQLLDRFRPALYFEWYPELLRGLNEDPFAGFDFLVGHGYKHFVFFTSIGDYYIKLNRPERSLLSSLERAATPERGFVYFDVFASTSESLCNRLVDLTLTPDPKLHRS